MDNASPGSIPEASWRFSSHVLSIFIAVTKITKCAAACGGDKRLKNSRKRRSQVIGVIRARKISSLRTSVANRAVARDQRQKCKPTKIACIYVRRKTPSALRSQLRRKRKFPQTCRLIGKYFGLGLWFSVRVNPRLQDSFEQNTNYLIGGEVVGECLPCSHLERESAAMSQHPARPPREPAQWTCSYGDYYAIHLDTQ